MECSARTGLVSDGDKKESVLQNYVLNFGGRSLECALPEQKVVWNHTGPAAVEDLSAAIAAAFEAPLDYPSLTQAVIPEDRVAIVVDPDTPCWLELAEATAAQLCSAGVAAEAIQVILNRALPAEQVQQLAQRLQYPLCEQETALQGQRTYLASTAEGERIYLPAAVVDADYVVTISRIGFDEQWGYRGTHSTVYPALASPEDQARLQGQSHQELTPENSRGQRQMIDEIGWLLGLQYSIQVIPSAAGGVAYILCGASDSVFRRGVELLNETWRADVPEQAETVLVALPAGEHLDHWAALTRTCQTAAKLVAPQGRVILLTSLQEIPPELAELIHATSDSDTLLRRLNKQRTPTAGALHALLKLARRAKVLLRSGWQEDLVEALDCIPLSDDQEVLRALAGGESYALLNGAQFVHLDV